MMWAADFDESIACNLEENCLEPLVIQIPRVSSTELGEENTGNGKGSRKGGSKSTHENGERSMSVNSGIRPASTRPFCGLTRTFWSKNDNLHVCTIVSSTKNGDDELPVFCVAAILILNRQKIIRETNSIDDLIKVGALHWSFSSMHLHWPPVSCMCPLLSIGECLWFLAWRVCQVILTGQCVELAFWFLLSCGFTGLRIHRGMGYPRALLFHASCPCLLFQVLFVKLLIVPKS